MSQNGTPPHHVHRPKIFKAPMLAGIAFHSKVSSAPEMTKLVSRTQGLSPKASNGSTYNSSTSSKDSSNSKKNAAQDYGTIIAKGGEGGTSRVFLSRIKFKGGREQLFAIKSYNMSSSIESEDRWKRHLLGEHEILVRLKHQNVVQIFELLQDSKGSLFEVLEFCEGGDLMTALNQRGLPAREADCYFYQLMTGLSYLHMIGIAHRDLKAENLVLTKQGTLKIADFGNAEQFKASRDSVPELVDGKCGSNGFMAPELFAEKEFAAAPTDVWSAGIIYFLMRFYGSMWDNAEISDPNYVKYLEGRKSKDGFEALELLKFERIGGKAVETEEAETCKNTVYSILDPRPERRLTANNFLRTEWARRIKLCDAAKCGI